VPFICESNVDGIERLIGFVGRGQVVDFG
jgi:hypothetical protein